MTINLETIMTFENVTYSREELARVFSQVQNADDWKAPINRVVPASLGRDAIRFAVVFFTATEATLVETTGVDGKPAFVVTAKGYRAGPAGDH